ncbi:hypothetical protein EK21DRAFT_86791 [Setomelanomma holmii]|uniref:Uncharacterized protein n=1 Tax=Setomelanomma holmii TaxID=210430 RepID=A0A9P4LMK0_9PLEO|nr:hypothetical protein EK21DRAFT_86791 [Setomelanomma holmii]
MLAPTVMHWAREELIPLLRFVWVEPLRGTWEERVQQVYNTIHELEVFEDFDSTVERLRLLLVNPTIMSRAETKSFGWMRREIEMCIGTFVRHADVHGSYKLWSLGTEPDPDHPRQKVTEENQDTYLFGGKFAAKDPEIERKNQLRRQQQHKPMITMGAGPCMYDGNLAQGIHRGGHPKGRRSGKRGGRRGNNSGNHRGGHRRGHPKVQPVWPQYYDEDFGMGKLSVHDNAIPVGGSVQSPIPQPGGTHFGYDGVVDGDAHPIASQNLGYMVYPEDYIQYHNEPLWEAMPAESYGGVQSQYMEDMAPVVPSRMGTFYLRPEANEFVPGAWNFC